jgi:uncharacterized protein YqgC (DUF456 family)
MNNKLKPALIGGVLLGVLSVIPFVNWVNICCCLWAILGGLLASYLYVKNSPVRVKAGDGAIVGALAGVVGAAVFLIIGVPLSLLIGPAIANLLADIISNIDPSVARQIRFQTAAGQSIIGVIIRSLIGAVLLIVFSTIGGLLGIPIFEKRKGNDLTPPPTPQNFGGGPGSYGSGV